MKMKNLEFPIVIDNILPLSKFYAMRDEFRYMRWSLDNSSYTNDGHLSWGWTKTIARANILSMYDAAGIIKLKIQKYLKTNLTFIRSHVNGQTSGQCSQFHIDFIEPGTYTVVVFTEDKWNTQWGGEFVFFDKDKKEYKYTTYIPNRGVLIPANCDHMGASPNAHTDKLRTTIAFSYSVDDSIDAVYKRSIEARYFIGPSHGL